MQLNITYFFHQWYHNRFSYFQKEKRPNGTQKWPSRRVKSQRPSSASVFFIPLVISASVLVSPLLLPRLLLFRNLETEEVGLSLPFSAVVYISTGLVALGSSTLPVAQVSTRSHLSRRASACLCVYTGCTCVERNT